MPKKTDHTTDDFEELLAIEMIEEEGDSDTDGKEAVTVLSFSNQNKEIIGISVGGEMIVKGDGDDGFGESVSYVETGKPRQDAGLLELFAEEDADEATDETPNFNVPLNILKFRYSQAKALAQQSPDSQVYKKTAEALLKQIKTKDPDFEQDSSSATPTTAEDRFPEINVADETPTKPGRDPALTPKSVDLTSALGPQRGDATARLEADLRPAAPVSFWRRRTVQALAALGILGALGAAGMKAKEMWETHQLKPESKDLLAQNPEDDARISVLPAENITEEKAASSTVLYTRIGAEVETQTTNSTLDESAKKRVHAASSNTLTESLYSGGRWEDLDGKWLNTAAAHQNVVKKLQTWGGYGDVLTVSAGAQNIDEMLEQIATSTLPHAELVAWKVATQIASIQDKEVVPQVAAVEASMNTITDEQIQTVVEENVQNPPPVPAPSIFAGVVDDGSAQLDSDLLDEDLEFFPSAPTFEDRFDVIEPAHLMPAQLKQKDLAEEEDLGAYLVPEEEDPTAVPEPHTLLASLPDVTEHLVTEVEVELEEDEPKIAAPTKHEPTSAPSLVEQAKTAINSLASKFKSWWS